MSRLSSDPHSDQIGIYIKVPDAATYTLLKQNSGKVHMMPNLTADCTITLPTEEDGLEYEFIYYGVAEDAQDWIFDTGSDLNYYVGGLATHDEGTTACAVVSSDGDSNSKMTILTPDNGTSIRLVCDGTLWYVNGVVMSGTVTSVTFADQ